MSNGDETLYTYTGDASGVMESLDEIAAGLDALVQKIQEVAEAASQLDALAEMLGNVTDSLSGLSGAALDATTEVDAIATASDTATEALSTLGTAGEDLATIGTDASEAASEVEGLNSLIDQLSGTIAEDSAIISGLNEQVANLEGQLGTLTAEEETASEGAGGLASALGTVGDMAGSAGEALQAAQGPLLMISAGAVMLGKSLFDAGTQGQQGLALVQGMAGATNADVQNLEQTALQLGDNMKEATSGFYDVASAGYSGQAAIEEFTAATEASKGAQADLHSVTSALTSEMAAYGAGADQAKSYTDQMIEAVLVGKQSFDAFSGAIGPLAAVGRNVGLSFAEAAASEATLTQINPNVRQDANELRFLFEAMDMSMDKVANTADSLGLSFDKTHYSSLNLIDKLKYLADISGGTNTVAFSKMVGGVNGVNAALALLSNQGNTYLQDLDKIQHSQGATDTAFERSEQTISAHMDKVGAAFSVFSTKLMDAIGPRLIPILDSVSSAIGNFTDWMTSHLDIVMPALGGLAALFGGVIVAAIVAFVAAFSSVTWIILGISAAIGVVVAGIGLLITHWQQITATVEANPVFQVIQNGVLTVIAVFRDLSGAISGILSGVIGTIHSWVQSASSAIGDFFASTRNDFANGMHTITSTAQTGGNDLLSWWDNLWKSFAASPLGSAILQTLHEQFAQIGQAFAQIGSQLGPSLGSALSGLQPALRALGDSFGALSQQILLIASIAGGILLSSWRAIEPIFMAVGQTIETTLANSLKVILPLIIQLGQIIGGALVQSWQVMYPVLVTIGQVFERIGQMIGGQLLTVLETLGAILGGVLLLAIAAVLGAIVGFAQGLATFIQGIVSIITGLVQIISGAIQIVSGIIAFFVDLATGRFDKLGTDLRVIWNGIVTMFTGIWNVIKGLFETSVGTIISFVGGLVSTVISFFVNLYNALVGHSVVVDLIEGVVSWFAQLPGRVGAFILQLITEGIANFVDFQIEMIDQGASLVDGLISYIAELPGRAVNEFNTMKNMVLGVLGGLGADALNAGASIVNSIATGIRNAIGQVGSAISSVTQYISDHLPHSPAKLGPLKDLLTQGSMITEQISTGMLGSLPKLQAALQQLTSPIALNLNPGQLAPNPQTLPYAPQGQGLLGGNSQVVALLAQILASQQQIQRQQVTPPTSNTLGAMTQQFNTNTFNGVQDVNALYNALNALQGLQNEYAGRGAAFNY